jgi:hypothetical protein
MHLLQLFDSTFDENGNSQFSVKLPNEQIIKKEPLLWLFLK